MKSKEQFMMLAWDMVNHGLNNEALAAVICDELTRVQDEALNCVRKNKNPALQGFDEETYFSEERLNEALKTAQKLLLNPKLVDNFLQNRHNMKHAPKTSAKIDAENDIIAYEEDRQKDRQIHGKDCFKCHPIAYANNNMHIGESVCKQQTPISDEELETLIVNYGYGMGSETLPMYVFREAYRAAEARILGGTK